MEAAADTVAARGMVHQDLELAHPGRAVVKERFAVVDAVPTPTPTPLLDAIRARAEICVLRSTLSAEMACGVCAANVRCLELERVCMRIDLVLSSSIDHTVSFYGDSDVQTPSSLVLSDPLVPGLVFGAAFTQPPPFLNQPAGLQTAVSPPLLCHIQIDISDRHL